MTRPELLRLQISDEEILRRVAIGDLIREHRGVYRVGHAAPSTEATYLAAVKACGEGACLFDRAAARRAQRGADRAAGREPARRKWIRRAREARARGEEFRRYTWWDVNEGRSAMATEVRALLASS